MFVLACQLKHPSLVERFLPAMERRPTEPLGDGLVSDCLREAIDGWEVLEIESENLDTQDVSRFLGFISMDRFGIIAADENGAHTFGKTKSPKYSFVEGPSPCESVFRA